MCGDAVWNGAPPAADSCFLAVAREEASAGFLTLPIPLFICARCGELWPDFFRAPDKEWKHYIEPEIRLPTRLRRLCDLVI
jgi:hypothetical protein